MIHRTETGTLKATNLAASLVVSVLCLSMVARPARAQHGVIREYAALAPAAHAQPLQPLFDEPLLDTSITLGPDQAYYLTGSAAGSAGAEFSSQIHLWRSPDMKKWEPIRTLEFGPAKMRSPEIHFWRGSFWLTLGREGGGTELLKFDGTDLATSAFQKARITERGEDPSLFLDDDGSFYWVMGAGEIARMKSNPMEGLAGDPHKVTVEMAALARNRSEQTPGGLHGAFLTKINGKYHLFVSGRVQRFGLGRTGLPDGTDDVLVSASDQPDAGFKPFYVAFPGAGQTTLFRDAAGAWWATWSGNDGRAVLRAKPAAFRVELVPATEPRWPIGFSGLETPTRFPFGLMLRPDQNFIYENGTGFSQAIPMDKVPGQKAAVPWIRDACIMLGHDGTYYMVGTSGNMDGIDLWKSPDLRRFEYVKRVWAFSSDPAMWYNKNPQRLLWAPELHFVKGTYWIPWCASGGMGNSLLKSTSGRAEGPYVPAFKVDRPVDKRIDASMFEDDDGSVYYVWQDGMIRKLNAEMNDFAGAEQKLLTETGEHVGYEGVYLEKVGPWYVLTAAEWCGGSNHGDGTYDMMYAVSKKLLGPYSKRRVAVPHAGHGMLFKDKSGRWCAAMFGNDRTAPFRALPGVVPLSLTDTGGDLLIAPLARPE